MKARPTMTPEETHAWMGRAGQPGAGVQRAARPRRPRVRSAAAEASVLGSAPQNIAFSAAAPQAQVPKPRHWTVTITAWCDGCRRETQQVTNRTLNPNGQQQSETTCYTCGAVTRRSSVMLGSRR